MRQGTWDIVRGAPPFVDDRRGIEMGGGFNNHNVEKLGITLNLRTERGKELLRELVAVSDVVTENFAAGVLARMGFPYEELRAIKPDIVYVSNSRLRRTPARTRRSRRGARSCRPCPGSPSARACPTSRPRAGASRTWTTWAPTPWPSPSSPGSIHRNRTGEGQWIDMACTEAGTTLVGPDLLDYTVNGRPLRRPGHARLQPQPRAARWRPTASTPPTGDDNWVAIACRDDADWESLAAVIGEPWAPTRATTRWPSAWRCRTRSTSAWRRGRSTRDRFAVAEALRAAGVPGGGGGPPGGPHRPRPRHRASGGCGRRRTTARWATCASTACPCTCRRPTG